MKILFLDIDGVLNIFSNNYDKYGSIFHQPFVDNLKNIIEQTGAKLVISSSWRMDGIITMRNMWKDRGLPGEIIDITPNEYDVVKSGLKEFYDQVSRGDEIQLWLNNHLDEVISFCIIDDDIDMLESQLPYFVKCSNNIDHEDYLDIGYGLTKQCAIKAIEILNKLN